MLRRLSATTWSLWLLAGLVSGSAYGLRVLADHAPRLVETVYAGWVYPALAAWVALPGRLVPFSLAEAVLGMLLAGSLGLGAWAAWHGRRQRPRLGILLGRGVPVAIICLGLGAHLFLLLFGYHYARTAVPNTFGLTPPPPDPVALEQFARTCVEQANAELAAAAPPLDAENGSRLPMSLAELTDLLDASFRRCPELAHLAHIQFAPPKAPWSSGLMARAGISGIFIPFTGEPHYDRYQPASSLPFTVAHEMAHQRGFAFESEANFVATIVCLRAEHPYIRYSGWAGAARYALRDLARAPARYQAVAALAGDGLRTDWRAQGRYWSRYASGRLARVSMRLNHAYLQANGVSSGVANYGEVTGWLLAWQAAGKLN
ncbi:MAG: DUF3810 domain-containing protein [Chloracidobacterium sp.]|uniref:DUF3810 domain-containing protein n=1 Tax=Chloracidobacterium validum TaxID=2821543 RepID=A0ABX8BFN3_9BACT|nr:DUF3810 domain-containing protein [Chloracidobacterium validum]QUW04484.1 DUF3810 domain-containing protein [Chloracidobacterium validum]